ncbi:MAG: putative 3-hydroxybutyryl-CoA dehydrogenase [Syntrophorhabdus sp. PtaU1.Bin058]|nr:MAG: putative 3-hydroxybutyryl-CoA dehydrogenase [Syntrophorhabdus sp. PtaU1.Bin058]
MSYKRTAIFGAGAMGTGIAQVLAVASMDVVLLDIKTEFVEKGLKKIASKLESDVKKGKLAPDEKDRVLGRIKGSIDRRDVKDVDLVIEAVIEDRKIKGDLFQGLNGICKPETAFATNTSTLSVTDLATLSGRPDKFLGLHFFNPVPAMKLVEVIPGLDTAQEVTNEASAAMKSIKKVPIVVQDCPGFLVNRILLSYMNEVLLATEEGISPELIDNEVKKAGFPMGPLELSDMVGWDVSLHTFPILHDAYGERFPSLRLVQKLNDAGRLGLKTGKGVYVNGQIDDEFRGMVASLSPSGSRSPFSVNRLILKQVNEAVYCLQEGVAIAEDIDRAMVLGTGFPSKDGVGGPLRWADEKGLDRVLARLEDLAATEGPRFWPHHLLKTYVAAGRLGKKTGKGFFEY